MSYRRIIIIGFMGTGKTTVAYDLARKLNSTAIDLDELVTKREGRGPKEIIEQDGEEAFRRSETLALREVLRDATMRIIAVGGGAWTVAGNRELIAQDGGLTVWLDAPFELCWKRIEGGAEPRPLARSRELALQLYAERRPLYKSADLRVSISENESAEETANKVTMAVQAFERKRAGKTKRDQTHNDY